MGVPCRGCHGGSIVVGVQCRSYHGGGVMVGYHGDFCVVTVSW